MCLNLCKGVCGCDHQHILWCSMCCTSRITSQYPFLKREDCKYIYKYISKWKLFILSAVSSIFTVPNVRLQPEAGESMRAFGKNNTYGKSLSNSKHWWAQHSQESTGKMAYFTWKVISSRSFKWNISDSFFSSVSYEPLVFIMAVISDLLRQRTVSHFCIFRHLLDSNQNCILFI